MREREVEAYFKRRMEGLGGEVRKLQWVGRRGAPDRVAMFNSEVWWVELKAPGKTPEKHQLREHERMRDKGMTVLVLDSKEAIDSLLAHYQGRSVRKNPAILAYEKAKQAGC